MSFVPLVIVEASSGSLRRYMFAAGSLHLTHECTFGSPVEFTVDVVEKFRRMPERRFKVDGDPPTPGLPPSGSPAAARAA